MPSSKKRSLKRNRRKVPLLHTSDTEDFVGDPKTYKNLADTMPLKPLVKKKLSCDMCYQLMPANEVHEVSSYIFLCSDCLIQLRGMPKGELKCSIERLLLGNVI